ncbi:hypothetical protein ACQZV8_17770, partial [Magnetococcales bacterium HHB-1]
MEKSVIPTLLRRLKEPSSWGGVAVLLMAFGFSQEEASAVMELLTAAAAAASIFMTENRDSG